MRLEAGQGGVQVKEDRADVNACEASRTRHWLSGSSVGFEDMKMHDNGLQERSVLSSVCDPVAFRLDRGT